MIINGNNIFLGAYEERRPDNSVNLGETLNPSVNSEAEKAIEEIKARTGISATTTISQESIDFLCSEAGFEKMKKDVKELYAQNANRQKQLMQKNESDTFWQNTGNQWLVFSESLYKGGFYNDMSDDEVKKIETILAKITAGMDHVSRTQFDTGMQFSDYYGKGANFFMSTSEVNLELISSTEALRYFGDKYVDPQNKGMFSKLIDEYYNHNSEILEGYQSPIESFEKAISGIHSGQFKNSAVNNKHNAYLKKGSSEMDASIYLGSITHTEQEKEQFRKNMIELFQKMRDENEEKAPIWNRLKDELVSYKSANSNDENIKKHILEQTKYTFQRMESYWSDLLNG